MGELGLTMEDLRRLLHRVAGANEVIDGDTAIDDMDFDDLGYDSLALLEAAREVERQYGVTLTDEVVTDSTSPRAFLELINAAVTTGGAQRGGSHDRQ